MNAPDDALVSAVELGEATQDFLLSDIGQAMLDRAVRNRLALQEQLEIVDPVDTQRIVALQVEARRYRDFELWLKEFVQAGQQAGAVLRQQQFTD